MGTEDNTFQISQINSTTTFFDWVSHYNDNVVDKLNRVTIYSGLSGDGVAITVGTTASVGPMGPGIIKADLADTITKGLTFTGGITFSNDVTIQGTLTYDGDIVSSNPDLVPAGAKNSINFYGVTSGFDFGKVVRIQDSIGLTLASASTKDTAEVLGVVIGVTYDGGSNPYTNYTTVCTSGTIEGNFSSVAGGLLSEGCVYFLDYVSGNIGGITTTEPTTVGHVSKPLFIGITNDGASTSRALFNNFRGQYLDGASGTTGGSENSILLNVLTNPQSFAVGSVVGLSGGTDWFKYTNIDDQNVDNSIGVVSSIFTVGVDNYINVVGSGYIDNLDTGGEYGILYIGTGGALTKTPPSPAKPILFAWQNGGDTRAFVVNQTTNASATLRLGLAGSSSSGGSSINDNLIINGGFDVWQRNIGKSSTYTTKGSTYFADRWLRLDGCSAANLTTAEIQRMTFAVDQTDVEGDPTYYTRTKHVITGAIGSQYVYLVNRNEDNRYLANEDVTLSFYAKSSVGGVTMGIVTVQQGNDIYITTPASDVYNNNYVTLTTGWQKYSASFPVPQTDASIVSDTSNGFIDIGFDVTRIGNADLSLSQVKVERGIGSTTFEPTNKKLEYEKCNRYYQRSYSISQSTEAQTMINNQPMPSVVDFHITPSRDHYYRFPVPMRTTATVSIYSPYSGTQNDAFNRTANKDMKKTSGTSNDFGVRVAPAGTTTITAEIITEDGIKFQALNGVVLHDNISLHYIADSDLNKIKES